MVFVAGKHINNIDEFSPEFHLILKLIRNGYEWLKWALDTPSLSVYYAQNEQDLLSKIQNGLHETLLLQNNALTLEINKAMSFDDADMELLVDLTESGSTDAVALKPLLSRYQLISNDQLGSLDAFLSKYNLQNSPLFLSLGFRDQLELYQFQDGLKNTSITQEAIQFAQEKASTVSEFVHYAGFYTACVKKQLPAKTNAVVRPQMIQDIYEQLEEVCFNLIYVPNIGNFNDPQELAEHLHDFILMSKFIGYRIKATAMENLIKNIKVNGVSMDALKSNIETYMTSVKSTVNKGTFQPDTLPQDGWLQSFTCNTKDFKLVIKVNSNGDVFLSPDSEPQKNRPLIG